MKKSLLLIGLLSFVLYLGGCCDKAPAIDTPIDETHQNTESESRLEDQLADEYGTREHYGVYANLVENTILEKNLSYFAQLVDENDGVRFYPYAYETNGNGFILTKDAILNNTPDTKYVRGIYDGSGFPIEKTIGEFFDEFLNAKILEGGHVEYTAEEMRNHSECLDEGCLNSVSFDFSHLANLFPDSIFVAYGDSGHEEYSYMDREDVFIVLNPYMNNGNQERRVVAIVHDQHTM